MIDIAGWTSLSMVDYPGKLAAVVWTQGCGLKCGYCHNQHLRPTALPEGAPKWDDFMAFLGRRAGLLDAVVFSGGEPLRHKKLPAAMEEVANHGFAVGLHTNGMQTNRLRDCLPYVDWIGIDYKAPAARYEELIGGKATKVRQSIYAAVFSGKEFEVRTTVDAALSQEDLVQVGIEVAQAGASRYRLQAVRPGPARPWTKETLNFLSGLFPDFDVRVEAEEFERIVDSDPGLR